MPDSFWSLYKKNVRTIFFNQFGRINNGLPGAFIGPLIMPITLTFGAALGAIIDISSRKPLSNRKQENLENKIDSLSDENLTEILKKLDENIQRSSSSRMLRSLLSTGEKNGVYQKTRILTEKVIEVKQALADKASIVSGREIDPHSIKLTSEEQAAIKTEVTPTIDLYMKQERALQRAAIKSFFSAPDNNGKKTHQILALALENVKDSLSSTSQEPINLINEHDFIEKVREQIDRLRTQGIWWKFGIGNGAKATRIETSLDQFLKEKTPKNLNALNEALCSYRTLDEELPLSYTNVYKP